MSELDAARREALAEALISEGAGPGSSIHSWRCEYPDRYGPCSCVEEAVTDTLAPLIAGWLAEAEQRGREDNADHDMCYVHGSRALEARLAEAKGEALREAATDPSLRLSGHSGISITRLLDRADRATETEQEDA